MKKKSLAAYERHLNNFYTDEMDYDVAIGQLIYLTNPSRGRYIRMATLESAYLSHKLGTILRKYDTVAFVAGYNDWQG